MRLKDFKPNQTITDLYDYTDEVNQIKWHIQNLYQNLLTANNQKESASARSAALEHAEDLLDVIKIMLEDDYKEIAENFTAKLELTRVIQKVKKIKVELPDRNPEDRFYPIVRTYKALKLKDKNIQRVFFDGAEIHGSDRASTIMYIEHLVGKDKIEWVYPNDKK